MASQSSGIISKLPPQAKIAIALVGIAALAGVGFFVYRKLKKVGENKDERKETQQAKNELDSLQALGVNPTFSKAEAEAKCNVLTSAAKDCDWLGQGATEIMGTIYSVKNKADWYLLSSTFGVRSWLDCGTGDISGSITTLLLEELDSGQMAEARRHLAQFQISL